MTSRGGTTYRVGFEGFIRTRDLIPAIGASRAGLTDRAGHQPPDRPCRDVALQAGPLYAQPSGHLVSLHLRTDGFVSVNALLRGEFVTQLLTFTGNRLFLNFSTGAAGSLRVEISDSNGTPIPGLLAESGAEWIDDGRTEPQLRQILESPRTNPSTSVSALKRRRPLFRFHSAGSREPPLDR